MSAIPQFDEMTQPNGPIEGPTAWYGPEMAASTEWLYTLTPSDLAELGDALASVRKQGLDIMAIDRNNFPLPRLGVILDDIRGQLLKGRGFALLRGVPVDDYDALDAAGRPVPQNGKGHLLGHVKGLGYDVDDPALKIDVAFKPGDMQFLHNHQILHDRTAFEDGPEPERKRHLLRLWLCPPDGRPLPDYYAPRYGSAAIGDRGGIRTPGQVPNAPLEAI